MNYSDLNFILFVLSFLFVYWAFYKYSQVQNYVLLFASIVFLTTWNWLSLVVVLINSSLIFFLTPWVTKTKNKSLYVLIILLQIALVLFYRLSYDGIGTEYLLHKMQLEVIIGLSFFALQHISYLTQVFFGKTKPAEKLTDYLLYSTYFPKALVGPIEEFEQFDYAVKKKSPHIASTDFYLGLFFIFKGFFKTVVVSRFIQDLHDTVQLTYPNQQIPLIAIWFAAIFSYFNMYCDFSGLVDIGRGVSLFFGIRLSENFDLPYISSTFGEYWSRWHISLSNWIRKFVYYPLSISSKSAFVGLLGAFLVSGLWHGFYWNTILWGALCAFVLILEVFIHKYFPNRPHDSQAYLLLKRIWVFHVYAMICLFTFYPHFYNRLTFNYTQLIDEKLISLFPSLTAPLLMIALLVFSEIVTRKFKKDYLHIILSLVFAILVSKYMRSDSYIFYYMRL